MRVDEHHEGENTEPPSKERFEAILSSISDGVFSVNSEGRLTCFNRAAEGIVGYPRSEVMGRPCHQVLRSDLCRDACPVRYTLENGTPVTGLVVYITDRSDQQVPVSISTSVFRNNQGEPIGGVVVFRDLRQIEELRKQVEKSFTTGDIVTRSPEMKGLIDMLPPVADSESTVLVSGESGTGKELFARAIHNLSSRKDGPFVAVNCASIPETLIESELFGYDEGAFTGANRSKPGRFDRAQDGTLFLDEIGDLPLAMQGRLLRILQDRTYEHLGGTRELVTNARIIAATNHDLGVMVERGEFRRDLYYRIRVIGIDLPPLRHRIMDVMPLVRHFIRQLSSLQDKPVEGLTPEAMRILMAHDYPGNVRELKSIIEHGFVLCQGPLIGVEHLPGWLVAQGREISKQDCLKNCERHLIESVLESSGYNRLAAAEILGIHKSTLFRKMRRLGIDLSDVDGRG